MAKKSKESSSAVAEKPKKKGKFKLVTGGDGAVTITGAAKKVAPDKLRANEHNYKEMSEFMYQKLLDSMKRFGFVEPITVRSGDENGPFDDGLYEIINGEHRWKAATELGLKEIRVTDLGNVTTEELKALMVILNELHGRPDQDDLAKLVAGLDVEMRNLLPYADTEVEALATAGQADLEALEKLGEGLPDVSNGGEGEDDEEAAEDVAEFLGLYALTPEEHGALKRRLEEEIVPHIEFPKRAGGLLDKMISLLAQQSGGSKNTSKKSKPKARAAEEDDDE